HRESRPRDARAHRGPDCPRPRRRDRRHHRPSRAVRPGRARLTLTGPVEKVHGTTAKEAPMFDAYHVMKFVHVYAAIIWLGSAAGFSIMAARVRSSGTPEEMAMLVNRLEWFGQRIYPVLSVVV